MLNLLYLIHRIPYPPNKGDKVRSFNLLKYLSTQHNVYLATFIDDPDDIKYISNVQKLCKYAYFEILEKKFSLLRCLLGFFNNKPLTLNYYNSTKFQTSIKKICVDNKIDAVVVFSSVMAQFVDTEFNSRMLVDFVDVDSFKWKQYSEKLNFPSSWFYRRESRYLLEYEKNLALKVNHSFFVTEFERSIFSKLVPESFSKTSAINNGVDSDYFSPSKNIISPFIKCTNKSIFVVFTGAMDYLPNIDAVIWFVKTVINPLIKNNYNICFYIVGRNPSQAVLDLASPHVVVTGTVEDVRPYLQHATIVVAPLRIARGIQNKILEAMSMGRPVIASLACVKGIESNDGQDIISATTSIEFMEKINFLIMNKQKAELIGLAARDNIIKKYSWYSHLKRIDKHLQFLDKNFL